jgi:hypothetical protein
MREIFQRKFFLTAVSVFNVETCSRIIHPDLEYVSLPIQGPYHQFRGGSTSELGRLLYDLPQELWQDDVNLNMIVIALAVALEEIGDGHGFLPVLCLGVLPRIRVPTKIIPMMMRGIGPGPSGDFSGEGCCVYAS